MQLALAHILALSPLTLAAPAALSGPWQDAYSKARTALAELSLSDKVGIVTGVGWSRMSILVLIAKEDGIS